MRTSWLQGIPGVLKTLKIVEKKLFRSRDFSNMKFHIPNVNQVESSTLINWTLLLLCEIEKNNNKKPNKLINMKITNMCAFGTVNIYHLSWHEIHSIIFIGWKKYNWLISLLSFPLIPILNIESIKKRFFLNRNRLFVKINFIFVF